MKNATRNCIQAPHATAPNTLPNHISPLNQPYSSHTCRRSSSSIPHHRTNIVPPPTALTQNAATCAPKASPRARLQQQPQLTVTPQLAYAASSSVCTGLLSAVVHACAQNDDDMMACKGVGGGGGGDATAGRKEREVKRGRMEGGGVRGQMKWRRRRRRRRRGRAAPLSAVAQMAAESPCFRCCSVSNAFRLDFFHHW